MQGERLGAYRITRELGSGGMGKVYAATVTQAVPGLETGSTVALKVMHPHLLETQGFFRRFIREADLGASIQHENVVRTLLCDQLVVDGTPHAFLVMEYVQGQDLRELQRELERVPEELCLHIGREVARGLTAIHEGGVIHRDLKPENVLITSGHVVKVMDLGVARLADERLRLSQSGAFVGSVDYAAPEQFGGGDVDARSDLHALGLLLYELSTGQHPYRSDDFRGVMKRVCEESPRRLGEVNPQLSAFFEEVVHALLAKRPEDRFASAALLLDVLVEGEDSAWWHERAQELRAATRRPLRRIRIPRETAVYGRDPEIERLRELYGRARAGDGQVVLIEGEAGIGKSRLIDELVNLLRSDGEDLNFLCGSYPPGGAATASGAFSTAYREQLGEDGAAPYLAQTPLLVQAFDALLRGDAAPTGAEPLTRDSLQTCFVHVTRALATEQPTVVLIDDLHFSPEEGRALFSALAMSVPEHRVLLIGTTRPGVSEQWTAGLTRLEQATPISLGRLGPRDLARLLEDSFGSKELASGLAGQIGIKSDGNPFFAFEIIRGLREGQFITQREDGTWVSTKVIDEIEIPSSVQDLVNARVADLTEAEREILDVAACWGFEFDPRQLSDVLGMALIPLLRTLSLIERKHRLVRSIGKRFVFDHHQIQETLHASLPELLRQEYHVALAGALEARLDAEGADPESLDGAHCVALCEHYLKGARGDRALRYLRPAQTHLTRSYLHAPVVELTERALDVPGLLIGVERAQVYVNLARSFGMLGRRPRQEECALEAERLAEACGDDEIRFAALSMRGETCLRIARHEEAESAYRLALTLARASGKRSGEANTLAMLASILQVQGRDDEARELCERGLEIAREIHDRNGEAVALGNLGLIVHSQGDFIRARELIEGQLALSRESRDSTNEAIAIGNLGMVNAAEERAVEAREAFERHLELSRQIGFRLGEAIASVNVGSTSLTLGDYPSAAAALESSLSISREIGALLPEGYGLQLSSMLASETGDLEGAISLVEEARAIRLRIGHADGVVESLVLLAGLRARTDDTAEAVTLLKDALQRSEGTGSSSSIAFILAHLACLPGGDVEAALAARGATMRASLRREVEFLLWQATKDSSHLKHARNWLDDLQMRVPEEYREAMCTRVRLNREILAAWRKEFEPSGDPGGGSGWSESETVGW